jgi:hypothetical protein
MCTEEDIYKQLKADLKVSLDSVTENEHTQAFGLWVDKHYTTITGWDESQKNEECDWHENIYRLAEDFPTVDFDEFESEIWPMLQE